MGGEGRFGGVDRLGGVGRFGGVQRLGECGGWLEWGG